MMGPQVLIIHAIINRCHSIWGEIRAIWASAFPRLLKIIRIRRLFVWTPMFYNAALKFAMVIHSIRPGRQGQISIPSNNLIPSLRRGTPTAKCSRSHLQIKIWVRTLSAKTAQNWAQAPTNSTCWNTCWKSRQTSGCSAKTRKQQYKA